MVMSKWTTESTSKALVPQVRHSEWQPTVLYLRTSERRVLSRCIIRGTQYLTAYNAMITRSCHPFLVGLSLLAWESWSKSWVDSYYAAAPSWDQGHWAPPCICIHAALVSRNFPHFLTHFLQSRFQLLFISQSPLFPQSKLSMWGITMHGQSPNCLVWFMSLYQLEESGCATFA